MNHEEALIKAFILPSKRERYLGFLSTSKGRAKIISELTHFKALDPRFMKSIIPSQHDPASVVQLCRSKGAGATCWVISENSDLDGKEVDLFLALKETIGRQKGHNHFLHLGKARLLRGRRRQMPSRTLTRFKSGAVIKHVTLLTALLAEFGL